MKRQLTKLSFLAGLIALLVPVVASAQSWPDYRRDDAYRRNRDADYRYLRDDVNRLDRLAKDFQREVDRDLDHDRRENGTRHEDRVNNEAKSFRDAVSDFKSRFGNGRELNRSSDAFQRVVREADQTERATRHHFDNSRVASLWSQIRSELNTIGNAYGYRGSIYNDRRDDVYRRGDNRNNVPWWQRLPGFPN
jgi:hypothetical protein